MRILFISNLFPPHVLGGYEILCGQVCQEFMQHGHEIHVLTSDHGTNGKPPANMGFPVYRELGLYLPFDQAPQLLRRRRWSVGKLNYQIAQRRIAEVKPDVIFVWSQLRLTLGAARAAQSSGLPVAYTFNDEHLAGYLPGSLEWSAKGIGRYLIDRCLFSGIYLGDVALTNSTCISRLLKGNLLRRGVPITDSRVIYQGIPIDDFPCKPAEQIARRPVRLLYVGQLHAYKGVHTLIEAAHRLANCQSVNIGNLSIVGDGPDDYRQRIAQLASEGPAQVLFLGKVPHARLPELYREHDIFVFPSAWQEPFGLTHLEAMASGTPVISTNDGGHGEFLEDGENALVFEKNNAEQLAAQIQRLADDLSLRKKLAASARNMVERRFTLDRYVRDLEKFLTATVAKS